MPRTHTILGSLIIALALSDAVASRASAALPTCFGAKATIVGSGDDDDLVGTSGADVIFAGDGDDDIDAGGGADLVCAGAGDDTVVTGGGRNRADGGAGSDVLIGGRGADELRGGADVDVIAGAGGNDRYAGGSDLDIAVFLGSPTGVKVDLRSGTAANEGSDTLSGIEALAGSDYKDTLIGNDSVNAFFMTPGGDKLDGQGGSDYVFATLRESGTTIDLNAGTASDSTILRRIENAIGSDFDDLIIGTAADNVLSGDAGGDIVNGNGGWDICDSAEAVSGCPPEYDVYSEPPVPPSVGKMALSDAGKRLAAAEKLTRSDVPEPPDMPQPPAQFTPPPSAKSSTAAAPLGVQCPPFSPRASIYLPKAEGWGVLAHRFGRISGYSEWYYSDWFYYSPAAQGWYRWTASGAVWEGPEIFKTFTVQQNIIETSYYFLPHDKYYSQGWCRGQATDYTLG